MTAWVCPKCGRVWAWWVSECNVCNAPVITSATTDAQPAPDRTALLWRVATAAEAYLHGTKWQERADLLYALDALHGVDPPESAQAAPVTRHDIRKRDAALGRAVRNMPGGARIERFEDDGSWLYSWLEQGDLRKMRHGHMPEEALGLDGDA